MIPQRNISLLSNRLAADGGRRIREDVLERDYCLAWFLAALSQSDLKNVLGFKGGTALKRCYFSDYRFSEDLDLRCWRQSHWRRFSAGWAQFTEAWRTTPELTSPLIGKIDRNTPTVIRFI